MSNEILPGISTDDAGQVTVDKRAGELLFNLALQLEDTVSAPVDIEHVLAAIVLAWRAGEINAATDLTQQTPDLLQLLQSHLQTVFERYGGQLGSEDL